MAIFAEIGLPRYSSLWDVSYETILLIDCKMLAIKVQRSATSRRELSYQCVELVRIYTGDAPEQITIRAASKMFHPPANSFRLKAAFECRLRHRK
jgi:hypothetical protein